MKNFFIFTSLITLLWSADCFLNQDVFGENSVAEVDRNITDLLAEGESLAMEISKAVGVSISPLLGMSVLGAYNYWKTPEEDRYTIEWYNSPAFWVPLLVILFACIAKDSAKTILPIPKQFLAPFDVLETVENKISGLIGLFFIIFSIVDKFEHGAIIVLLQKTLISVAYAGDGVVLVTYPLFSVVRIFFTALFTLFCCFMVWLVSHSINILILLCPFALIDLLLKMFRNSVIAILLGASLINPYMGLAVSLVIVVFAYFVAGWSFRFMVFGSLFSFDILMRRSNKYKPGGTEIKAFAGKKFSKAPTMSYGTIKITDESFLEFTYKPWLILPSRTVYTKEQIKNYEIGVGSLSPVIVKKRENSNSYSTLFRLRPLYKSHEQYVAEILGIQSIREVGLSKGLKNGWQWLAGQLNLVNNS